MSPLERRVRDRFWRALRDYRMIDDGDRVLIALSGGKDSLALVELLGARMKVFQPKFYAEAIHVRMENIKYESSAEYLMSFCEKHGVKLHVVTTSFDATTDHRSSPCFLCSWNRRKQLFQFAQENNFNKIALGHHQDDIIHTALMNLTFNGHFSSMLVKQPMDKMPLTLIRPLCLEHEDDLKALAEAHAYEKQRKLCPYDKGTNRTAIADLYKQIEKISPDARQHIWHALTSPKH